MSKSLYLREARTIFSNEKQHQRGSRIRAIILDGASASKCELERLSEPERHILRRQVEQSLAKERRRANAHSMRYDMGRHISLYLLAKSLK